MHAQNKTIKLLNEIAIAIKNNNLIKKENKRKTIQSITIIIYPLARTNGLMDYNIDQYYQYITTLAPVFGLHLYVCLYAFSI